MIATTSLFSTLSHVVVALTIISFRFSTGTSMQALAASRHGDFSQVLHMQTIPIPEASALKPHELLVRVAWSDVNPVDLQKLHGGKLAGEVPSNPPFVPGFAGSGIVVQCGSQVTNTNPHLYVGSRVAFLADPSRRGTYAEYCVVDGRAAAVLPLNVSLREAACLPLAGCTAYEALHQLGLTPTSTPTPEDATAKISPLNRRLLIVGAAGGVGSWATRLARTWHPALEIIATASSETSQNWCLADNGASRCVRHDQITESLEGGLKGSVDAILCLTEPTPSLWKELSEVIRPYGRICVVVAGASIQSLDLGFLFFKSVTICTETVFSCFRTDFAMYQPSAEIGEMLSS